MTVSILAEHMQPNSAGTEVVLIAKFVYAPEFQMGRDREAATENAHAVHVHICCRLPFNPKKAQRRGHGSKDGGIAWHVTYVASYVILLKQTFVTSWQPAKGHLDSRVYRPMP